VSFQNRIYLAYGIYGAYRMTKQVTVVVERVLGAVSLFKQGGSMRLILPKKALSSLKISKDSEEVDSSSVILIATDKGLLMRPLADFIEDEEMKGT
jgi:hypothetical protein